jgi:hypothetical protein
MTRARRLVIHCKCIQSLIDAVDLSAQFSFFDEPWLVVFYGQASVRNRMLF